MANTVDLDEITEYHDTPEDVDKYIAHLATLVQQAKGSVTIFTGAGISTSSGIPDFRGPNGAWTRRAQKRPAPKGVRMVKARPTPSHMAIVALIQSGHVRHVTSQNVDGLHRRSGLEAKDISELHGNMYKETCWKCDADYIHDFDVSVQTSRSFKRTHGGTCTECIARAPYFCHCTSRTCTQCPSTMRLKDSIIHFRESLPQDALARAFAEAATSKLCIVLGSSLRVSPACEIPRHTLKHGGKMCIVNLQTTPSDDDADVRIFYETDVIMTGLCRALKVHVPPFVPKPKTKKTNTKRGNKVTGKKAKVAAAGATTRRPEASSAMATTARPATVTP